MVRIAIIKNTAVVSVDGDGLLAIRENGDPVLLTQPVVAKIENSGIAIEGKKYLRLTFSAASAVYVNSKPYRGVVEISLAEKGLLVVNELPLDEYLAGLINCEISSAWPIEAVKAQAVIARSYALHRKEARRTATYHLESSVIDQVYEGSLVEDSRARRGVSETTGEVLTYNGAVIQAFYHSNCGGRTESSENAWGLSIPYLKGVDCKYCLAATSSSWEQKLTLRELEDKLAAAGYRVANLSNIKAGSRNNRGRLKNVVVVSSRGEIKISGEQFRKAIGYGIIKSTNFSFSSAAGAIVFSGLGNGHGVGLCQWGSKQRALDGFDYKEILSYYYPGTELKKLSDIR